MRAGVVAQAVAIMDKEHVESPQWPSTKSASQKCCDACYSGHGCTDKGKNCPAPAEALRAQPRGSGLQQQATVPAVPPGISAEDFLGDFEDAAGRVFTIAPAATDAAGVHTVAVTFSAADTGGARAAAVQPLVLPGLPSPGRIVGSTLALGGEGSATFHATAVLEAVPVIVDVDYT